MPVGTSEQGVGIGHSAILTELKSACRTLDQSSVLLDGFGYKPERIRPFTVEEGGAETGQKALSNTMHPHARSFRTFMANFAGITLIHFQQSHPENQPTSFYLDSPRRHQK